MEKSRSEVSLDGPQLQLWRDLEPRLRTPTCGWTPATTLSLASLPLVEKGRYRATNSTDLAGDSWPCPMPAAKCWSCGVATPPRCTTETTSHQQGVHREQFRRRCDLADKHFRSAGKTLRWVRRSATGTARRSRRAKERSHDGYLDQDYTPFRRRVYLRV
jgi:hypothetical protein